MGIWCSQEDMPILYSIMYNCMLHKHSMIVSGRNRFGSVPDFFSEFIGSVRFGTYVSRFDAVRPALFGRVVARSGWVRLVSVSDSSRFRNETVRFGSDRLARITSYSFLNMLALFNQHVYFDDFNSSIHVIQI